MYEAAELKKGVFWVGAIDWDIREFHGYTTNRGTTYNAYLIKGEKTALVDTVKAAFFPEMISRIKSIQDPAKIDYLIMNHLEMDHSGAIPLFKELAPNAQIVATDYGSKGLLKHFPHDWPVQKVKTGHELSLGGKTLKFLEAYMLHWPDSMFTYLLEDSILLSNDGFGQHYASFQRFDDDDGHFEGIMEEAAKYFANILMPLAPLIPPLLKKVEKMRIPIEIIAPSHGIIWRSHTNHIINSYVEWSTGVSSGPGSNHLRHNVGKHRNYGQGHFGRFRQSSGRTQAPTITHEPLQRCCSGDFNIKSYCHRLSHDQ